MIKSFRDRRTEAVFESRPIRRWSVIQKRAQDKLKLLNAAVSLGDLGAIGGNRLEALKGDRRGQYSIRINDQWRICFIWTAGDAYDVEIVDYHG